GPQERGARGGARPRPPLDVGRGHRRGGADGHDRAGAGAPLRGLYGPDQLARRVRRRRDPREPRGPPGRGARDRLRGRPRPGRAAARIISRLARSPAAPAALGNADEGVTQAGFRSPGGGFMTNWPFVYTAEDGNPIQQDFGWSRWPAVEPGRPSAPPLGGIHL